MRCLFLRENETITEDIMWLTLHELHIIIIILMTVTITSSKHRQLHCSNHVFILRALIYSLHSVRTGDECYAFSNIYGRMMVSGHTSNQTIISYVTS